MNFLSTESNARVGDLVELVGLSFKHFILRLEENGEFQSHRGVIKHNEIIGKPWGSQIFSHNGSPFFMLQPSIPDLLKEIPRATQIMYPKEIGMILLTMGIGPGVRVLEAGTGSGSLTTALAYAVGSQGKVYSYEIKADTQRVAQRNLARLGLSENVEFKVRDIAGGFDETGVDALFLDVANPYDYIGQARKALKPGGYFGCICPTANQVMMVLNALRQNDYAFIDVCEISVRYFKAEPTRFRPTDRMIAHTGYLTFARPVCIDKTQMDKKLLKESGMLSLAELKAAEEDNESDLVELEQ